MRKFLLGVAAGVVAVALAAPSYAAEFKYTGIYRLRGVSAENLDRNEDRHDGVQGYDALARPRFTATTDGGKIWAIYELDFDTGNAIPGVLGRNRITVGTNRWLFDFAVPGTTLRARIGKTDYASVDQELWDTFGRSRFNGIGVYGKLFGPLSLSFFTIMVDRTDEGGTRIHDGADNQDEYYLGVTWKAAPKVSVTPFIAFAHANRNNDTQLNENNPDGAITGHDLYYFGLNVNAKVGILSVNATGVFQDGKIAEFPTPTAAALAAGTAKTPDVDIEAWAFLLRSSLNLGKLKLGFNATFMSGDDDAVVGTGNKRGQKDGELQRFVVAGAGGGGTASGGGWIRGPQLVTSRQQFFNNSMSGRIGGGNAVTNNLLNGDGRNTQLNGALVLEIMATYQVTKTLTAHAALGIVRSVEKAPNICTDTNGDGVCGDTEPDATTFTNDKNFGTELDLGANWFVYKTLRVQGIFAYLFAGDYGTARLAPGSPSTVKSPDDSWALLMEVRHFW